MFSLALTTASAAALGNGGATLDQIIASLYGDGSPGVFYNMRASSGYVFQDRFGTTLATAATNPVGFCLDLSQGLAEGPELRGSFVAAKVGTVTDATYNTTTGQATLVAIDAANQSHIQLTGLTSTTTYKVTLTVTGSATIRVRGGSQAGTILATPTQNVPITVYISGFTSITFTTAVGTTGAFTLASCRTVAGNHWRAASDSVRPLLADIGGGILVPTGDGVDDLASTPAINLTGTTAVTLWAGVRKYTDAAGSRTVLAHNGTTSPAVRVLAPSDTADDANFAMYVNGPGGASTAIVYSFASPASAVITGRYTQGAEQPTQITANASSAFTISDRAVTGFANVALNIFGEAAGTRHSTASLGIATLLGRACTDAENNAMRSLINDAMGGGLI
jgi:hypothetical protein